MRIFFSFPFLFLFGIAFGQQALDTLTVPSHQKLKKIPTCIGVNCLSGESCSTDVPPGSQAAYLVHDDVTIGKIKKASMICEMPNGICSKMIFYFESPESVSQAGKQAAKQFGKPQYKKSGSAFVYTWLYDTTMGRGLQIKLEVAPDLQSALMVVEEHE